MKSLRIIFVLLSTAFFMGCPVRSLHPLFSEKQISFDPALVGRWADGEDVYTFKMAGDNSYEIFLCEEKPPDSTSPSGAAQDTVTFIGQLGRLGKSWFLDTFPAREVTDFHFIPAHIVFRFSLDADTIRLAALEGDWLKKELSGQRLTANYILLDGDVILTGNTSDLQQTLRAVGGKEKAFPNVEKLVRVH